MLNKHITIMQIIKNWEFPGFCPNSPDFSAFQKYSIWEPYIIIEQANIKTNTLNLLINFCTFTENSIYSLKRCIQFIGVVELLLTCKTSYRCYCFVQMWIESFEACVIAHYLDNIDIYSINIRIFWHKLCHSTLICNHI